LFFYKKSTTTPLDSQLSSRHVFSRDPAIKHNGSPSPITTFGDDVSVRE
jgi:hypothetical protein